MKDMQRTLNKNNRIVSWSQTVGQQHSLEWKEEDGRTMSSLQMEEKGLDPITSSMPHTSHHQPNYPYKQCGPLSRLKKSAATMRETRQITQTNRPMLNRRHNTKSRISLKQKPNIPQPSRAPNNISKKMVYSWNPRDQIHQRHPQK